MGHRTNMRKGWFSIVVLLFTLGLSSLALPQTNDRGPVDVQRYEHSLLPLLHTKITPSHDLIDRQNAIEVIAIEDCNGNGISDDLDISDGTSDDCNFDNRPDECIPLHDNQDAKLFASDATPIDLFGTSVSISGDTAVVGADRAECSAGFDCGAAYIFRFDGTNWIEQQKLIASDAAQNDRYGFSVSVSGDTAIVGAYLVECSAGFDCGAAYVYQFDGTNWIEQQKLTASDGAQSDWFGFSVSISGDTAVVGTLFGDCVAGAVCGAAYVYRFNGVNWIEQQKLIASDAAQNDRYGFSVSVSGDTAVVGTLFGDCVAGDDCGAAYVYRFNGVNWIEQQKLIAFDAAQSDQFGWSVSIDVDVMVVGSRLDDCAAGFDCGAAYVYRFDGMNWIFQQKLTASDPAQSDWFGYAVSITNNELVVGAHRDGCLAGTTCGAVYNYRFNGTNWIEQQKLVASDASELDQFGISVSADGDMVIAGAIAADCSAGPDCGAVYIFTLIDRDLNNNGIVDLHEDCDLNGVGDVCDLTEGTRLDCNMDGIPDVCGIALGDSGDCNINGIPDECETPDCPADLVLTDINSGGLPSSFGGIYSLVSSTGQHGTVGILVSTNYELSTGFWYAAIVINPIPTSPLPDPVGPDGLACGGGDNYGLPCMTCDGGSRIGLLCLTSSDCPSGNCIPSDSLCLGGTCGGAIAGGGTTFPWPKSRFIGFSPNVDATWVGQEVAIRVTLENIGPNATCNGESRYAGAPVQFCEGGACTAMFWASKLQADPHFMDWTTVGTVQLYGEEVVSGSRYVIQAVDVSSASDLTNENNFSTPGLIVDTAKWGDVDVPLSGFTSATQPAISDVLKLVDKWLGNLEPRKSRTQLQPAILDPNASVGIADVLKGVDAWLGTPYPFTITTCTP